MIDNIVLSEIVSKVSHKARKEWYQDRTDKLKGMNVFDKNSRVSKLIDSLNKKNHETKLLKRVEKIISDCDDNFEQLVFDFD